MKRRRLDFRSRNIVGILHTDGKAELIIRRQCDKAAQAGAGIAG